MPTEIEGFAYINIENPMAAWNVVRSNFYTPECLAPLERQGALSFAMADLLREGNDDRAAAEFQLESFRRQHFPNTVSRLTGLFIFDEVESAAQVWSNDAWPGHFKAEYLTDVGAFAHRSSRLDSNWIALMRNNKNFPVEGWEVMAEKYWSGEPASEKPIWERIIEGYMTIWGLDLKSKAFEEVQHFWPQSLELLAFAANAAMIGSHDGAVMPRAKLKNDTLNVSYYLRMEDAKDMEFCRRLGQFLKTGGKKVCRLTPNFDNLVRPDFRCYSFERRIKGSASVF